VPTGATITSGQGTNSITVDFGASVTGFITLNATNAFGTSTTNLAVQTAPVTVVETNIGSLETMVYPNPFQHTTEVKAISPNSESITIELHDMNGITLKTWTGLTSPVQLEFGEGLPSGVYTLTIKQKGVVKVFKLVKLN
ncbi:MAG: T9SS type A sorting domain-containing protein, partial [Cytophagales bacterium]|nr:T9SS type A sorting domain-containing protein [Cytophagales bacterium]